MLTVKQQIERAIISVFRILPIKQNRISFICYNCSQYSCNPKYLTEYLVKNFPDKYELIWFYENDSVKGLLPDYVKKVKKNTITYFISLLTSKYVIANVTLPRIVPFKKNQIKINTWHGTAFKGDNNKHGNNYNRFDYFIAENGLTEKVLRKKESFNYQGKILKIGMPRNDMLINPRRKDVIDIKKKIGINPEEKIVIYAPTFRENIADTPFNIDFDGLVTELENRFGGTWKVLFRYHHMQRGRISISNSKDVSTYPDMQELLLVSDILITDYSSTMWDFSLMNKPVFLYAEDIDRYINYERGDFYWPLDRLPFEIGRNNNELFNAIRIFDEKEYISKIAQYHKALERFNYKGNATAVFVEKIIKGDK